MFEVGQYDTVTIIVPKAFCFEPIGNAFMGRSRINVTAGGKENRFRYSHDTLVLKQRFGVLAAVADVLMNINNRFTRRALEHRATGNCCSGRKECGGREKIAA